MGSFEQWQRDRAARMPRPSGEEPTADADVGSAERAAAERLARAATLIDEAAALLAPLVQMGGQTSDDGALIDAVAVAERVTASASAVQTRASVAYRSSQIIRQEGAGVARRDLGRGVADEIALARRISPARAANQLALGRVLVESMPRTFGLLERGEINRWAAEEVAAAVLVLDDAERARIDEDLAGRLPQVTARRAGVLARARASELDPQAALTRVRREVAQRHVSLRPASDAMVRLSALLPTVEGVAVFAALDRHARAACARGAVSGRVARWPTSS